MAAHWLNALGSKLLSAGASFIEQARFVQQLRQLDGPQARERFTQFVSGLAPAARSGFALTLAALKNGERDAKAKQFIQSLIDSLSYPERWRGEATAAPTDAQHAAAPSARPAALNAQGDKDSLSAAANLVDAWLELDDQTRAAAVAEHARRSSVEELRRWLEHLAELRQRLATQIDNHRDNEARFAAGRYVEDQHDYRMLKLAGAPPDAKWLEQLRLLERCIAFIDELRNHADGVIKARKAPAPSPSTPTAAPTAAQRATPTPAATAQPRSEPYIFEQIEILRATLEADLASGRVDAALAPMLQRKLDKLAEVNQASARGEVTEVEARARVQALMQEFMPYFAKPSAAMARATPRGRELITHAGALKTLIGQKMAAVPQGATAGLLGDLVGDVLKVQTGAAEEADDSRLLALETSLLRPAARALHEALLTPHALLAQPLWACAAQANRPNALFLSGAQPDLRERLEELAVRKGLEVESSGGLQNLGQMRWDTLRACHVALFDLRGVDDLATLAQQAPRRARDIASSAYELGLAFALGKPVVVVTGPDDELPFDIDLAPLRLQGDEGDVADLAQALDEAFYVPQRRSDADALAGSLAQLRRLCGGHAQERAFKGLGLLADALLADPTGFVAAANQVFDRLGSQPRWQLLLPSWAGSYPDAGAKPRCFHVMPFDADWSDEARDAARRASAAAGLDYRRGDEAEEGRIVHAIWDDLCRASAVLVDLTGLNLNVLIELGMAQAIGRPVLLLQRAGSADFRPRHIEKLRVHRYGSATELQALLERQLLPLRA